jgi:tetratricopeptide (TPR) repeat protein
MSADTDSERDDVPSTARSAPPLRLARSLDEAAPGVLVAIDRRGQVRSPLRFRALQYFTYASLVFVATFGLYAYTQAFGLGGSALVGVFIAWVLRSLINVHRMNRASTLLSLERLDEAEPLVEGLTKKRFVGTMLRGHAQRLRAGLLLRRGQHAAALVAMREAMGIYRKSFYRALAFPWIRSCEYAEVGCLCELGQLREAKDRFAQIDGAREGEYLRVSRWTAELTIAFASGESTFDRDSLFERAQRGLRMTMSAGLLALCAWGYAKLGDEDMAAHLLQEAFERNENGRLAASAPSLWRWMNEAKVRFVARQAEERDQEEARLEGKTAGRQAT